MLIWRKDRGAAAVTAFSGSWETSGVLGDWDCSPQPATVAMKTAASTGPDCFMNSPDVREMPGDHATGVRWAVQCYAWQASDSQVAVAEASRRVDTKSCWTARSSSAASIGF